MKASKLEKTKSRFLSNLKSAIREKKLTLEGVAFAAGVGKGTVSEIVRGKRDPSLDTIIKIADALEISLVQLFEDCE